MKLCTVVHRVSLLLVVCDQSPTLWGTTFGQFELLSAHRADELAPNRDQVKFSLYLGVIHKLRWQDEVCRCYWKCQQFSLHQCYQEVGRWSIMGKIWSTYFVNDSLHIFAVPTMPPPRPKLVSLITSR